MHKSTKSCSIIIEISFYICYIDREEFKFLMLFLYLGNKNIVWSEILDYLPFLSVFLNSRTFCTNMINIAEMLSNL